MTGSSSVMTTRAASTAKELTESIPLDVAAAQYGDRRAARRECSREHGRDRDCAARLDDELHAVEEETHGAAERRVLDQHHVVEIALVMREGHVSDLDGEQAVGDAAALLELDRFSSGACTAELRRTRRFDADDARVGEAELDRRGHTGAESTAADGHEDRVDVRHVGGDLEANGALPRNDHRMIVRRNEHDPFFLDELFGLRHS